MVVCLNGQYLIMSDNSCVIRFVSPNSLSLSVTKPSVSPENHPSWFQRTCICVTLIGNFTLCVTKHAVKANTKNAP